MGRGITFYEGGVYRVLTERSFAGIYVVQEGKFVYINTNAASYAGYTPEELLGKNADILLHPEDRERAKTLARQMLSGQRTDPYEFRIVTKDGRVRWIMETVTPFVWEGKQAVLGNSMDITLKMEMDRKIAEREEYFRVLIDSMAEGVFVLEGDRFIRCNRKVLEMFRCAEDEIVGRTPYEYSPPFQPDGTPSREKALGYIQAALVGDHQFFPWIHRRADGSDFETEVSLASLRAKKENHIIAIVRDVSERRSLERAMAESEARFRYFIEKTPDLIFSVDRRGYFTYANPKFAVVLGYRPEELAGKPFSIIISPESLADVVERFRKGIRGQEISPYEAELLHRDGRRIAVEFHVVTMYDREGKPVGRFGIGRDITERRLALKHLRESQKILADVLNFSPDATFAVDRQGRVTVWNRAMEEMTGVKEADIIGKGDYAYAVPICGYPCPMLVDIVLTDDLENRGMYDVVFAEGDVLIAEINVQRPGEGPRILWVKAAPIKDEEGNITGVIETIRDITKQRQEEEALRLSEEKFRAIFDDHVIGMYQSTFEGRFLRVNRAMVRMCGYESPEQMVTEITDIYHQHYADPEDRTRFLEAIGKTGYVENFELKVRRRDGTFFWASLSTRAVKGEDDRVLYFEGAYQDITARKEAEEALKQSEERYRTIVEGVADGYYEVDLRGNITFFNDAALRLLGMSVDRIMGSNFTNYASPEDARQIYEVFHEVFITGMPKKGLQWRVIRPDGKDQHVEVSVNLIRDVQGRPTGFRGILHDVTERRKAEEQIQWIAYHDQLTGLPNRILFYDRLNQVLSHAKRSDEKFAVVLLDLDNFKDVNDRYGHAVGDELLKAVACRLTGLLRDGDTVARFGGDEFLIILPAMKQPRAARSIAQKIVSAMMEPFIWKDAKVKIMVSVGIAIFPDHGLDGQVLIQKADMAMYRAKAAGGSMYQMAS